MAIPDTDGFRGLSLYRNGETPYIGKMNTEELNAFFLRKDTAIRRSTLLVTMLCTVLLLACENLATVPIFGYTDILNRIAEEYVIALLTFLAGYASGAVAVLLFFIVQCNIIRVIAYSAFPLLIVSLAANVPAVFRWYRNVPMTVLAGVFFQPSWATWRRC